MIKIHSKKALKKSKWVSWHWFTVCGKNGKVFATSETYTRRSTCFKAANDFRFMMEYGVIILPDEKPVKSKVKYGNYPEDDIKEW